MGKGDQKTRKGKVKAGSYGKTRPRKTVAKTTVKAEKPVKVIEEVEKPKKASAKPKAEKPTEETQEAKPKATKTKKTEE